MPAPITEAREDAQDAPRVPSAQAFGAAASAPCFMPWTPLEISLNWAVYAFYEDSTCLWVDACPLREIMGFPGLSRQSIYQQRILFSTTAKLFVFGTFPDEVSARRYQFEARRVLEPVGNRYIVPPPVVKNRGTGAVRCITTGQVFKNASEAARVVGCHATTMSNHLKRRPGYSQIMGLEFKRIGEE